MTALQDQVGVGDIACTRSKGLFPTGIRVLEELIGLPGSGNHCIIVHHKDPITGNWIGIQAQPKGVDWVDLTRHLKDPYTVTNADQPKTEAQRYLIAVGAEKLLHLHYDWIGIVQDAALWVPHIDRLLSLQKWASKTKNPTVVVCSSYADFEYDYVGLASPGKLFDRNVTPGHWIKFSLEKLWRKVPGANK